jgi:hypothetical protein
MNYKYERVMFGTVDQELLAVVRISYGSLPFLFACKAEVTMLIIIDRNLDGTRFEEYDS